MLLSKYLHLSKSIWKGPSGSFVNVVFLNGLMTVFLKSGFDIDQQFSGERAPIRTAMPARGWRGDLAEAHHHNRTHALE